MDPAVESLRRLAEDLTDRVDSLEKENTLLKKQAKQASEKVITVAEPAPAVSEAVALETSTKLAAAEYIAVDQVQMAKESFVKDPEAAHRTLHAILDAQIQTKKASTKEQPDLSGGRLLNGGPSDVKSYEDSCLDRMKDILGMIV